MSNITVLGWFGRSNAGDCSYKFAFPKIFPEHNFNFVQAIEPDDKSDCVIMGGGDIVNDGFLSKIRKSNCPKKYLMSVDLPDGFDYSEFSNPVVARNLKSHTDKNVLCMPDFSFILEANPKRGKVLIRNLFKQHDVDQYENVVAIVLNVYVQGQGSDQLARELVTYEKVCFDLAHLMDSTNASFILIPFCTSFPSNDCLSNSYLYSKTKFWKKHLLLYEKLEVQDILDIMSAVQASITTRLHSAIFSCIGGTPFIDLTHHDKNLKFMEYIGKKDWSFNYWRLDMGEVEVLLNSFLQNQDYYRKEVSKIAENCRKKLQDFNLQI